MDRRTWTCGSATAILVIGLLPSLALAFDAVPACRLDDELASAIQIAAQWGLQDLKESTVQLPFDSVAINPRGAVPARTLRIQIVKDAAASMVDQSGCIKPMQLRVGATLTRTDGPCVATRLGACSADEQQYMRLRFQEIHGGFSDTQTGYEAAGACYMTNLHACLHKQRLALLSALGPRDAHSVKGTCVTSAREPVGIQCSAGALKMLLSREAVAQKAPTVAMVLVIAHELGHLAANQSSSYDAADNVIDLGWPNEDKIARIQNQCRSGESLRKRERDADEIGLSIARRRLPEIAKRWPEQGTTAWLITQAIHQSTNLTRWNNDWHDDAEVDTPRVFKFNPDGGQIQLDGNDIEAITTGKMVSGRSTEEVQLAARRFLCEMTETRSGRWDVLMQSGSTHGTMTERLGELASALRPVKSARDSAAENLEATLGGLSDLLLVRHRAYLRELEGAMCTLIERPLECSSATVKTHLNPRLPTATAPTSMPQSGRITLPLNFVVKGPYREVLADPAVLTMAIKTVEIRPTSDLAIEQGKRIAAVYSALLAQIDDRMREHGGYWVHEWHSDVEVDYNRFSGNYTAYIDLRSVARVPRGFALETLPALREIRRWGRVDDVHIREWSEARHEVVIHFFRNETPGSNKDSQRVITSGLRFDQIFDLTAARSGSPNQPSVFFRDLLSFLHTRLQAAFGATYTLKDDSPPAPFYITSAGLGDNFYLPADWQPLIYSGDARTMSDAELRAAVDRIYIDNSREQNVSAIFGSPKP